MSSLGRFARRATMRGAMGAALGMAATRPLRRRVPGVSLPAAAGGFAAGAAQELPAAGVAASGLVALALVRSPRRGQAAGAVAVGAAAALATRRWWPVAPRTPAEVRRASSRAGAAASSDGEGVTFVVNESAGPARGGHHADELAELLPMAAIVRPHDGDDLGELLEKAAAGAAVLGVVGGDGTINAAASVARDHALPLVVVPGGTLNHFARDLGVTSAADAAAALAEGHAVAVDIATIDGRTFLNTASFGSYAELVDARERLEDRIGKWPALVIALVRVLRTATPCRVEIDGRRRDVWMAFVGNCRYHPHGFAPSWRERLDDGLLDVRIVDADHPWARTRLVLGVLTGRLGRSSVYREWTADRMVVHSLDGPLRLARDGETFDSEGDDVVIGKADAPLAVYAPPST